MLWRLFVRLSRRPAIRLEPRLWDKVCALSAAAGCADPDEWVTHLIEREIEACERAGDDQELRERLRGLGYLR